MQKQQKPLEDELYRRIEYHLHHVNDLRKAEKASRDETVYGSGLKLDPGVPRGTSRRSDPTAIKAVNLADNMPHLWLDAISATYAYYEPHTNEGRMARLFYGKSKNGKKVTIRDVAGQMNKSPRMACFYRDWFVMRCAIYAAEKGLIRLSSVK